MISEQDRKLLTLAGRDYIFDVAMESNFLKEQLTFKEHIELCKQVQKLTYKEVVALTVTEDIRAFESKFKKFLKYSMAAIAGMKFIGLLKGPPIAMFILYIYRKASDVCVRSCFAKLPLTKQRKICKYECQLDAAKRIEREIRSQVSKCSQFEYANRCEKRLQKEYIKWAKRVQKLTVKLNQAKAGMLEKERKKRQKELAKKAAQVRKASLHLSKNQTISFIEENETLRKNLSFKNHLKLYEVSKYIKEEDKNTVKPIEIDPKKEKQIRTVMYLGLWALPIPFFNDLINYMVKKYSFGCASKCFTNKKLPQNVCYNQCAYLGAKYAVKTLNAQLTKCRKAKNPMKCKNKVYNMLEDWKQREVERKIKFESSLKQEIRKAKKKNLKQADKG